MGYEGQQPDAGSLTPPAPVVLPSYADLARATPAFSSWQIPGIDPHLGMLSLLNATTAAAAADLVRHGRIFSLDAALDFFDPPLYGRAQINQLVVDMGDVFDEVISNWNTQGSSQWDGFRHIRHPVHGFYGGLDQEQHGVSHWATKGIVGRGVLADVARYRENVGRPLQMDAPDPIEVEDVEATLEQAGVTLTQGDILLIRTGWLDWYTELPDAERADAAAVKATPGLRTSDEFLAYLWDSHVSCVAADNPALELWPAGALVDRDVRRAARTDRSRLTEVFMHYALLPLLGIPIGELWSLGSLAADCAADGVYEFMLCSAPIMSRKGLASPPNAVAIK